MILKQKTNNNKRYADKKNKLNIELDEYKNNGIWSVYLEEVFGVEAAVSFAIGSDIFLDYITEGLHELSLMPNGAHVGQLKLSVLRNSLPEQFLTNYNYEFLYKMKCTLCAIRKRAKAGRDILAHSVLEELIIYLCSAEAVSFIETEHNEEKDVSKEYPELKEWVFDLFGDMDIKSFLYSDLYLPDSHPYHFDYWDDLQFYMTNDAA